jgi:hypothetical protein
MFPFSMGHTLPLAGATAMSELAPKADIRRTASMLPASECPSALPATHTTLVPVEEPSSRSTALQTKEQKPACNRPSYPPNLRSPERLAEPQALAAIALQVRQSHWRSRSSDPPDHHGANILPDGEKDELENHRQTPCHPVRFYRLLRDQVDRRGQSVCECCLDLGWSPCVKMVVALLVLISAGIFAAHMFDALRVSVDSIFARAFKQAVEQSPHRHVGTNDSSGQKPR